VHYVNRIPGDLGSGISLGFDAYNSKGYKIQSDMVDMPRLKCGERAKAKVHIDYTLPGIGPFTSIRVVI